LAAGALAAGALAGGFSAVGLDSVLEAVLQLDKPIDKHKKAASQIDCRENRYLKTLGTLNDVNRTHRPFKIVR
jgi:hypothetical protein